MMRLRVGALLFLGCACVLGARADLKAVFAFKDRVVSIRFPELNYWIATTVDEDARQVAVTFPREQSPATDGQPGQHLEISLEALAPDVRGEDYHRHYLDRYADTMGSTSAPFDDYGRDSMALLDCRMAFLFFRDHELRDHKAILITSIDNGIGVVILLDTLASVYDSNESASIAILRSIQFEN
jgi:hypothetical protein